MAQIPLSGGTVQRVGARGAVRLRSRVSGRIGTILPDLLEASVLAPPSLCTRSIPHSEWIGKRISPDAQTHRICYTEGCAALAA